MNKDFRIWHDQKSDMHENKIRAHFHEREIWSASLGANVGFEQDGRGERYLRPVIVLKKFNNEVLWCIPLTTNQKKQKYYYSFDFAGGVSTAILSQIRLIDAKRLQYKVGDMPKEAFEEIKEKLKQLLA
ncbi:type II toxin-antitoxin system PemK/MazF family toxin [Patescibacteria group bacterium]|nr:type II toxin-antitoxin system PemK/MazF family toxin [Patescibacteria group bacterium]MDE1946616.1 type II toxin-antitoxin system PemK/MazF family toxin [Patescibacteria group bacterium]MDE2010570.1 type II toxin-antitoxin system PemK/MazF family toxin [Patescibacteria group bacterium]MDE2233158.1 type II toxin-antitoxin system PemK/MazF family toxin [Patescibacteria group bacterium]